MTSLTTASPRASIFVTGGAMGIGRATVERFCAGGYLVGIGDIEGDRAAELARTLNEGQPIPRAIAYRVDVTDAASIAAALDAFVAAAGGLSVLFNNAGVLTMGALAQMRDVDALRMIDVNVRGVLLCARAALPHLEARRGVLAQMCSAAGIYGTPQLAVYSATKFFVRGLTEALDLELEGKGVRVFDVMPAYVNTVMVTERQAGSASVARVGVSLEPRDIAEAVWRGVHGGARGHVIPQPKIQLFRLLSALSPSLGRVLQKKLG